MEKNRKHRTKALAAKRIATLKKKGYKNASWAKSATGYATYPGKKSRTTSTSSTTRSSSTGTRKKKYASTGGKRRRRTVKKGILGNLLNKKLI